MFQVKLGITIFLTTIIPTGYLTRILFGGMYGSVFKQFPPALYISLSLILSLAVCFIIASIFFKKTNFLNRLPVTIPAKGLLLTGSLIILLPQILRIFTSMIEGGGASFALISFVAPFILVAKLFLYIGIVKLLMAVKPHESYVYE